MPLIGYLAAGHYTGIDVREDVIAEALRELEEAGLQERYPRIDHVESLEGLDLRRSFAFVWAFSLWPHLEDPQLTVAFDFIAKHLTEEGVAYGNVHLGEGRLGSWADFPILARPLDWYEERAAEAGLRVEPLGRLQELGHLSGDRNLDSQFMLRLRAAR